MNSSTNNQFENIFEKGCLVQLSVSIWGGAKKIDEAKAKEALGSEWAKAKKSLIDPEALKPICKIRNEARLYLGSKSLPFPIDGVSFVPFEVVPELDEWLQSRELMFNAAKGEFEKVYPELCQNAKGILGELYNESDYPQDISSKFAFSWRFITLNAPGENSYLSPEFVAKERQKFINTMEEARELGVAALREEFRKLIESCVDRLTPNPDGTRRIFRDSLVDNFGEFFESFKGRNIFEDGELEKLCEAAKGVLSGVNPEQLRENENLRGVVRESMKGVQAALESAIVEQKGRKLKMD